jgi:hypothetical protein
MIKEKISSKTHILDLYDSCLTDSLSKTNENIILRTMEILSIKTRIEYDYPTDLKSSDRLIDICKKYGASLYYSGPGGRNYMDMFQFKQEGIDVEFQNLSKSEKRHILDLI